MKNLVKFIGLNLIIAVMVSCSGSQANSEDKEVEKKDVVQKVNGEMKTTASGLKYEILKEGRGKQAKAGDLVEVHYTGTLPDGTKFDSSVDRGQPLSFPLGQGRVIKGWDEGIALLNIGSKAKLYIPSNLGYGEKGAGGVIPPNSDLIFEVELISIKEPVKPWDISGVQPQTTASGLKYYLTNKTGGDKPKVGSKVQVHYSGFLEDGTKFDSSVERGQPFSFVIGQGQVIKGWDEGIALLGIGEKAKLVIPSSLGYGDRGAPPTIPGGATLHFDVELISFQ